jgi:hypothetical protein
LMRLRIGSLMAVLRVGMGRNGRKDGFA